MTQAAQKRNDGDDSNVVAFPAPESDDRPTTTAAEPDVSDMSMRIGEVLKAAREAKGLTLEDAGRALKLPPHYLSSIETMYAGGVPNGYLNGYLRAYANHLGLPAQSVVDRFAEECGAVSQAKKVTPELTPKEKAGGAARAMLAGLAAAGVVAVAGAVIVLAGGGDVVEEADAAAAPRNAAKESLFTEVAASAAPAQLPLRVVAVRRGLLEVRGTDGTRYVGRPFSPGESYYPRIGAGWTVNAPEDAGAFEWRVGDVVVGPLGEAGAPAYSISVDAAAAAAEKAVAPALADVDGDGPARN